LFFSFSLPFPTFCSTLIFLNKTKKNTKHLYIYISEEGSFISVLKIGHFNYTSKLSSQFAKSIAFTELTWGGNTNIATLRPRSWAQGNHGLLYREASLSLRTKYALAASEQTPDGRACSKHVQRQSNCMLKAQFSLYADVLRVIPAPLDTQRTTQPRSVSNT